MEKMNIGGTISHIEKRLDAHDSAFDSLAERNVEAEIENILDRLAVRMYDEGQLDKPSLMGRQVAIVKINEAKAQLTALIDSAKREVLEEMRPANATIESMRMYIPRTHTYKGKEYPACSMCGFCPEAMNAFIDAQLEQSKEEL